MRLMDQAKFDVRIRERLLARGEVSASEVEQYLEGLKDVADQADDLPFNQPALEPAHTGGNERAAAPHPAPTRLQPVARPSVSNGGSEKHLASSGSNELDASPIDEDDEDDDDEDDDEEE